MAVLALVLYVPTLVGAEATTQDEATWARELKDAVPKTPDEFMRRLKFVLDNPKSKAVDFAETISGIPLTKWEKYTRKTTGRGGYAVNYKINVSYEKYPQFPYDFGLDLNGFGDFEGKENFGVGFRGIRRRGDEKRQVCVTPALTKEFFGEPASVDFNWNIETLDKSVMYYYSINGKKFLFKFNHIFSDSEMYKNYNKHKEFCANGLSISINLSK